MKKITCVSYHDTGSSAVDDYLREFDGIQFAPSDVECRFLQDPDGISDLEYNLIDNWHRLNSEFAIKRYENFVKLYNHTYSLIFGPFWKQESKKYIKELIDFEFPGYWHGDIRLQSSFSNFFYMVRRGFSKISPKKIKKTPDYNYFPNLKIYHPKRMQATEFYDITKNYCEKLCESNMKSDTEYIVLDQCVSTTDISRYLNYINDLKVVIVDRDPRDVYIQGIRAKGHVLPHDPKLFSKQFRDMRLTENQELTNKNILKVQFEDLIYKYDETTTEICEFLGLDKSKHTNPKKYFNPDVSIKNTCIWKTDTRYSEQIKVIEQELSDYLYHFPD